MILWLVLIVSDVIIYSFVFMHMCRGTRYKKLQARRHSAVAFRGAYGQICFL